MIKQVIKELSSILDMLRWTSSQFNASQIYYGHGTNNFWDETLHLVLPSLYLPIELPIEIYNARLTSKERNYITKQVTKRINMRIPVPYLTNKAWFCGLEFYVDERVFVPRSPIAELIQSRFSNFLPCDPKHILDMCTGSGCIAIATALAYQNSEIDAVDISYDVLQIAERNIRLYSLENRVIPIYSDLFQNLPEIKYDLILANPPYVKENDIINLPKEFHSEPKLALCAGKDGLQIIKQILAYSDKYLNKHGLLICEVGNTKQELIKSYPQIPFHWINCKNGGDGVFMLTCNQLTVYKKIFNANLMS